MRSADSLASERMTGFPVTDDALVSIATWQDKQNVRWAFQHMREIIPTQAIRADPRRVRPLPTHTDDALYDAEVTRLGDISATAEDVFADTWTDAVMVLHEGQVVDERYHSGM